MKVTVFKVAKYQATERRTDTTVGPKTAERYRVTWRVYVGGTKTTRKRGGFVRKGQAEQFADVVRSAALNADGWTLDHDYQPVHRDVGGATVWDLTQSFFELHWPSYKPTQRAKVAGRLNTMRRMLVTTQTPPPPCAESYLKHCSLKGPNEVGDNDLGAELAAGRDWLRKHSLPLGRLNRDTLTPLRTFLVAGRPHNTARTYWQVIETVITWGIDDGMLQSDPMKGMPKLRRDTDAERVDETEVPSEAEAWTLAWACTLTGGAHAGVAVLLGAFAGLRIGEMAGLRVRDVTFLADGRAVVRVHNQYHRVVAAYSDDGVSCVTEDQPKGRGRGTPARPVQLRPDVGSVLAAYIQNYTTQDPDAPVLVGLRGARFCADTYRNGAFARAVEAVFPAGHRLNGLKPHTLRHAAVSYWMSWAFRTRPARSGAAGIGYQSCWTSTPPSSRRTKGLWNASCVGEKG